MTVTLAEIWRHPIKGHGREALQKVRLEAGKTMPWDRVWAVTHEGTKADGNAWAQCANFSRGAKAPSLAAIDTVLNETTEMVTLAHPERPTVTLHPERDRAQLIEWVNPLMPAERAQSTGIMRVPGIGMTDSDFQSISIGNLATHRAIEERLGAELSTVRWRGNLWLDRLPAWEEASWVGKTLAIADARIEIREQITRCLATTANPATGARDADTLGALDSWGHQEFGLYGVVTTGGEIGLGETARLL